MDIIPKIPINTYYNVYICSHIYFSLYSLLVYHYFIVNVILIIISMSVFRYGQKVRTFGTGYLKTGENSIA